MATPELVQLPNKDLWRGYHTMVTPEANIDVEVIPETAQNPVNRAMAQILKASNGAHELTCLWCGMQGDERSIRDHLKSSHASVVNPMSDAQVAMAQVAVEQKNKIEAKK